MSVLLIALPNNSMKWTPLNLLYLAGTLDYAGVDCKIVDQNIDGYDKVRHEIRKGYDIVGLSVLSTTRWDAFDMARIVRVLSPRSQIVMGGVHASVMPEQCAKHSDVVIKGEGEAPFMDLCMGRDPIERTLPIDDIPDPAWHKIDLRRYPGKGLTTHDPRWVNGVNIRREPRISVMASRSCMSKCHFCSSWWVQGKYRMRDPEDLACELYWLNVSQGIRSFYFVDDAFYLDKTYGMNFCEHILDRKMKIAFHVQTRADVLDLEYCKALRGAGCYIVSLGVETGSEKVMAGLNKTTQVEITRQAMANCKESGLRVEALLMIGNVSETDETIEATRQFLRQTKPFVASAADEGLMLLPGTVLYQQAKREGMIDDSFWDSRKPVMAYRFSPEQIVKWRERVLGYDWTHNARRKITSIFN